MSIKGEVVITAGHIVFSDPGGRPSLGENNDMITRGNVTEKLADYYDANIFRRMDDFAQCGLLASHIAVKKAKINTEEADQSRLGSIFSTVWGPMSSIYKYFYTVFEKGPKLVSPMLFPYTVTNAVVGVVSRLLKLKGTSTMLTGCCPVNFAYDLIKAGKADLIVAGGVEVVTGLFDSLVTGDEYAGDFIGAAVVVLENKDFAQKRGADILGKIQGYSTGFIADEKNCYDVTGNTIGDVLQKTKAAIGDIDCVLSAFYKQYPGYGEQEAKVCDELKKKGGEEFEVLNSYEDLTNTLGCQSVINLLYALHLFHKTKKKRILSNSFFYGGNFNTLFVSGH